MNYIIKGNFLIIKFLSFSMICFFSFHGNLKAQENGTPEYCNDRRCKVVERFHTEYIINGERNEITFSGKNGEKACVIFLRLLSEEEEGSILSKDVQKLIKKAGRAAKKEEPNMGTFRCERRFDSLIASN